MPSRCRRAAAPSSSPQVWRICCHRPNSKRSSRTSAPHLRYRHNLSIQVTETAAHLLPWLRVVSAAVRHQAERQADECAALGDRKSASNAVARVALAGAERGPANAVWMPASSGGNVVRRVRALADPPPQPTRKSVAAVAAVLLMLVGGTTVALLDVVQDVVAPEPGEIPTQVFR